jgi:hypothetical protein
MPLVGRASPANPGRGCPSPSSNTVLMRCHLRAGRRCGDGVVERGAQGRELGSRGRDDAPVELKEQGATVGKPRRGRIDEPAVRPETVPLGEDGGGGLRYQVGMLGRRRDGDVGQIRDDQVKRPRHRGQEVAGPDVDPGVESMATHVGACEGNRVVADVGCPDLGVGASGRDSDRDRSASGSDVGNARGAVEQLRTAAATSCALAERGVITRPGAVSRQRPSKVTSPMLRVCRREARSYPGQGRSSAEPGERTCFGRPSGAPPRTGRPAAPVRGSAPC